MSISFAADDIAAIINSYIDIEDFDAAYDLFLKNNDKLSPEVKEAIQYAFPPGYFKKIQDLNTPYRYRIKRELEKGDPNLAYRIYLENANDARGRLSFINQCFSSVRKVENIYRKSKINNIINEVLLEHEKHVSEVKPDISLSYVEFCDKLKKLRKNHDINGHDVKNLKAAKQAHDIDKVNDLINTGKYSEANSLLQECKDRRDDDRFSSNKSDSIIKTILAKITINKDFTDSLELCNNKAIAELILRDSRAWTEASNSLVRQANTYCLNMLNANNYSAIKDCHEEVVKSAIYNDRNSPAVRDRLLSALIHARHPSLGLDSGRFIHIEDAAKRLITVSSVRAMIDHGIFEEQYLHDYLASIIDEHNQTVTRRRRTCDARARDIRNHGVKYLYHFTQLTNIRSIMDNGILPVSMLKNNRINYNNNDSERYDGNLKATSISISFPNWKMFYSVRMQDENCKWAVIELSVDMLDHNIFECYSTNAARGHGEAKVHKGSDLFGGSNDEFPEDPQAELLVEGRIDPRYITKIYVNDSESRSKLHGISKPVEINSHFFSRREKDACKSKQEPVE